MIKDPLISFCIPTYNRAAKVFQLVNTILQYKENNIEVLVLDNCSSDNTVELLNKINDSRFRFERNEKNIGGIKNPFKALSMGNGKFCFLCLDKDFVDHRFIDDLIKRLFIHADIVFGHCILNNNNNNNNTETIFESGFQSVFNMAYLSAHPSGMFYKKDFFIKTQALGEVFETDEVFGFQFELINAEMAMVGKALLIDYPLFSTETKEECRAISSFTYKNTDEVFFSPKRQIKTFHIYSKHLQTLPLLKKEKYNIMRKILKQFLVSSTLGYKQTMRDDFICQHYYLETKNITLADLVKIYFNFLISFLKEDFRLPFLNKLILIFDVHFIIFKNKISVNYGK